MTKFRLVAQPNLLKIGNQVHTIVTPVLNSRLQPQQIQNKQPQQIPQQIQNKSQFVAPQQNNINIIKPNQQQNNIKSPKQTANKFNNQVQRTVVVGKQEELKRQNIKELDGIYRDKILALKNVGQNKILIMIACGPSVSEINIEKLKDIANIDTMTINKPDKRIFPTTYWSFCDISQYNRNVTEFNEYNGTLLNAATISAKHKNQILIRNIAGRGFSKNLCIGYNIGRSTTYASMQIAYWMNYDHIIIFGLDMCAVNGKLHHYGQNPDVDNDTRIKRFNKEAEHYEHAAQLLSKEEREKFIICSNYNKYPFVDKFKRIDHTIAIDEILKLSEQLYKKK